MQKIAHNTRGVEVTRLILLNIGACLRSRLCSYRIGLTVHQASMSDPQFRLCVVHGVFPMLEILNSITYLVSIFSVLHADSEKGTQHIPWPLTFFRKIRKTGKFVKKI